MKEMKKSENQIDFRNIFLMMSFIILSTSKFYAIFVCFRNNFSFYCRQIINVLERSKVSKLDDCFIWMNC